MSTIYKLFVELIKLFIPRLNIGSLVTGVITKLLFALIFGAVTITTVVYVKNQYNDWKHNKELREKAEQNVRDIKKINDDVIADIEKTQEGGKVTVDAVVNNAQATSDIKDEGNSILTELDSTRKDIAAGKPVAPKKVKKAQPPKKDGVVVVIDSDLQPPPKTQTDANINAMWQSYCTSGGNAQACAANS